MKRLIIIISLLFFVGTATAGEGRLCHHLELFIKEGQSMSEDRLQDMLDMREHSTADPETIKEQEQYLEKLQAHVFLVKLLYKERRCDK